MGFRERLLATLRAAQPVLDVPGMLVAGSEIPNLLEEEAAATLVISEDVDLAVPVEAHTEVKSRLADISGLRPAPEEPSVWVPDDPSAMIELNFVGRDENIASADETYLIEDSELPLLVFGPLSLLTPGEVKNIEGVRVPLPRPSGLLLEKLVTDRTAEKGERDLLVVLGLLMVCDDDAIMEAVRAYAQLPPELRHAVRSNLTILSLMSPRAGMPDPSAHRGAIENLLARLDAADD